MLCQLTLGIEGKSAKQLGDLGIFFPRSQNLVPVRLTAMVPTADFSSLGWKRLELSANLIFDNDGCRTTLLPHMGKHVWYLQRGYCGGTVRYHPAWL